MFQVYDSGLRPYYTIHCFTCVFDFFSPRIFICVLDTNMLVYKREKITQREKMFLYYTMRWVKTQASCIFLAFLLTNLPKMQTKRIV